MKKLYEIPEHSKLYIEDKIIIFDHIDGFYSYCWLEEDRSKIVHIKATTLFEKYKDGYKYVEEKMKIIDLLNKIANGEEVPKVIKKQWKYEWQYDESREEYTYMQKTGERFDDDWLVINMLNDEVEILEDKPSEEIRKLQSEIDILTNKVEHYYSEVVSFRDKTRYLKDELNKLKEK